MLLLTFYSLPKSAITGNSRLELASGRYWQNICSTGIELCMKALMILGAIVGFLIGAGSGWLEAVPGRPLCGAPVPRPSSLLFSHAGGAVSG